MYKYSNAEHTAVKNLTTGATGIHPGVWMWEQYQEWVNTGGVTEAFETRSPEQVAADELQTWRDAVSCGPLQFRRALRSENLMDTVKTYLETADEEVVEAWEYATTIYRNDPMVIAVKDALGKTDEELDAIFHLALTFR